jgi:N6-L-threonylcarbamoyladenine synthase
LPFDPARLVLGIESSCDETAAAVVGDGTHILSNVVASQVGVHAPFGGVVPELASRHHLQNLLPVIQRALGEAGVRGQDLTGMAVTQGPGLLGALLVGFSWAKAVAWAWQCPLVGISHLEGHLCALNLAAEKPPLPHVALLVSGGHTSIYLAQSEDQRQELGRSRDDAAGEAFDKAAKMLGLGYPGGIEIERLAKQGRADAFNYPRPLIKDNTLDFSFSGLKTALWQFCQHNRDYNLADVCASFQEAIVETLCVKLMAAVRQTGASHIALGGGVACNSRLRQAMRDLARENGLNLSLPAPELCTDNAAMIAAAGAIALRAGRRLGLSHDAFSRLPKGGAMPE